MILRWLAAAGLAMPLASCDGGSFTSADGNLGEAKRVFITRHTVDGDLKTPTGAASGLDGGDAICMLGVRDAGLGGTWRAWLSDSQTDAITRISGAGPWVNVSRTAVIFESRAALAMGPEILGETLMDETGDTFPARFVWTGTLADGTKAPETCSDWTATTSTGVAGEIDRVATWTQDSVIDCFKSVGLYCFEQ